MALLQVGVYTVVPMKGLSVKARVVRSELRGFKVNSSYKTKVGLFSSRANSPKCGSVHCSLSSSSNGSGSTSEDFDVNDGHYVDSSVVEAVEMKSGVDGFVIKMRDGRHLRCVHNCPQSGLLLNYAPHPAIILKMEDGTGLLLPIIARPTMYQVVKEMINKLGYDVRLVRVTKRVRGAYFSQLYMTKVGNESECIIFDLRPSDAINIAVRCKVPIQVNKYLAYSDGMRVIESGKLAQTPASDGLLFTELDRPSSQPCPDTEEFCFVRNMMTAAVEERYKDAAQWRDKLGQFRAKRNLKKYT